MRIDRWKCDKCGVEFEHGVHHHEEFDLCDICHNELHLKKKAYDDELATMRAARTVLESIEE